ncbi:methyltransferase domain-containing protein [Streptomyces termitum]|uniref:Protein-L-isoaspartate O-methyltransferase n=1 Tax=Streptomyces termitum TaxID=67368 RepID=A0A918SQ67_9ACTN|nr:methyltransferase domain-containing protein [Streptomyces termitum]GHA65214.1 protein-L-isoaspartate O-methyltransferase [Streptomyces termitum]
MKAINPESERAAIRALGASLEADGFLPQEWEAAVWAVPRSAYVPDRIYVGDDLTPLDRADDPEAWLKAVYADAPVVTQINDGQDPDDPDDRDPSSSASAPGVVFRMLALADLQDGHKVLEIGTGTGWNAGLLSRAVGGENVVSVEVDEALAGEAAARLKAEETGATVIAGDGAEGYAGRAPYDRVIATCSVRSVPFAWVAQTRPGGIILTPWDSAWCNYGLLRLVAKGDGRTAEGVFTGYSAFMLLRSQRNRLKLYRDVVHDEHVPRESATSLTPWAVAGDDLSAQFSVGLAVPDVWHVWQPNPVPGVMSRLWLGTADATSWAAVDYDGETEEEFKVYQHGPASLWNAVKDAYTWWVDQGRPDPGRFGMTVTPEGQTAWLDGPDRPVPLTY